MSNIPLSEQLSRLQPQLEIASTGNRSLSTRPEAIHVERVSPNEILVTPADDRLGDRLRSHNVFYLELRRCIRLLTGDQTWSIRYASQITGQLLPMLHSSQELRILIDPMAPYRDPTRHLASTGTLSLLELPSNAHYFLTRENFEAQLARLRPVAKVPTVAKKGPKDDQ